MKRILYASDCNPHSAPALKFAFDQATKIGAQLHLLYVYSLPPVAHKTIRPEMSLHKQAASEHLLALKNYVRRFLETDSGLSFSVLEHPSISEGILQTLDEVEVDLIILGRKDKASSRGLLAGNIANALLRKVRVPLWVIPNRSTSATIKTMVYATDFESDDIMALRFLSELAAHHDATIKVIHIPTPNEYKGADQMEWFKELVAQKTDYQKIDYKMIVSDDITEGLSHFALDSNADLLAMLERQSSSVFGKLFHADLVRKVKSQLDLPIISFNANCF